MINSKRLQLTPQSSPGFTMRDWHRRMEGFKGPKLRLPEILPVEIQESQDLITWSSSDEEDNNRSSNTKPLVVMRLNFDQCVSGTAGHTKPQVSRSLINKSFADSMLSPSKQVSLNSPSECKRFNNSLHMKNTPSSHTRHAASSIKVNTANNVSVANLSRSEKHVQMPPKQSTNQTEELVSKHCLNQFTAETSELNISQVVQTPTKQTDAELKFSQVETPDKNITITETTQRSPVIRKSARKSSARKSYAESQLVASPKSPIISSGKRRTRQSEVQLLTPRSTSPVLSGGRKSKRRSSPVLNKHNRRKMKLCRNTDTVSQTVEHMDTQFERLVTSNEEIVEITSQESLIPLEIEVSPSQDLKLPDSQTSSKENDFRNIQDLSTSSQSEALSDMAATDQKIAKNGMAWQLDRVLSRQKTESRMRRFEFLSGSLSADKYKQLIVKSVKVRNRQYIAMCNVKSTLEPVILILPRGKTKVFKGSLVTIFSPWVQYDHDTLHIPVITKACNLDVQLASKEDVESIQNAVNPIEEIEKNFSCACRQDPAVPSAQCNFKFPVEVLHLLFWSNETKRCITSVLPSLSADNTENCNLSIASAISEHSNKPSVCIQLIVQCQRLFVYQLPVGVEGFTSQSNTSQSQNSSQNVPSRLWQALVEDSAGEFCILELGSKPGKFQEGVTFHLRNLTLTKKLQVSRSSGLKSLLANLDPDNSQSQIFEFSVSACQVKKCDDTIVPWPIPKLTSPTDVSSRQECRVTLLGKILYLDTRKNVVYVLPDQWKVNGAGYVKLNVRPLGYLPNISPATCVCIRDIAAARGELFIDRYTTILELNSKTGPVVESWLSSLTTLQEKISYPSLPTVSAKSLAGDIVSVTGVVKDVDEESACVWPVCGVCNSEVLQEMPESEHGFECAICASRGPFPNKAALTVTIDKDNLQITINLQQETIEQLLPGVQDMSESFHMESVLGSTLSSILCIVAEKSHNTLRVEEISYPTSYS